MCAVFETSSLMPGDLFLPRQTSVWRFTGIARETSGNQISTVYANASAIWGWMVSNWFSCSCEHQSSRKLRTVLFHHHTKLFANPPIWPPFKQYMTLWWMLRPTKNHHVSAWNIRVWLLVFGSRCARSSGVICSKKGLNYIRPLLRSQKKKISSL